MQASVRVSRSRDLVGARNLYEVSTKSPSPHRAEYLLLAFHAPSPAFALCFSSLPVPSHRIMNEMSSFNDKNIPQSSNTLASDSVAPSVPVIPGRLQPFFPTSPHVQYIPPTVPPRASQARPSGPPIRRRPRTNQSSTHQSFPTTQVNTPSFTPEQISAAQAQGSSFAFTRSEDTFSPISISPVRARRIIDAHTSSFTTPSENTSRSSVDPGTQFLCPSGLRILI